ncbi:MAG: RagB/SusD family nutrient uptake outer membrane protein [Bacteroidales bacterium]|nr:RagB/SusD family nutrient uptake outer membrane protein [Bacteroidales bacterium]
MKKIINISLLIAGFILIFTSCTKDLDTVPLDEKVTTAATVFDNPEAYTQVLAKLYAGLAVSGQEGPAGNGDISGIDEGFGQYLRGWWYHQELPTDEAVISWNDQTIKDFHYQTWGSSDVFIAAMYYRIFYQIAACNEYIRETSDAKLNERGASDDLKAKVKTYRAEARFLRALSYFHAMDLFGDVPFVTEDDKVGNFFPHQISRTDLFNYIETELKDIESLLIEPRTMYARADKATAWSLLATIYLNAEVYTGTPRYTDCITYCKKIINAGYSLNPDYKNLFLADNDVDNNEVIFAIAFDGDATRTYGGTNFIIHAAVGGDMNPSDFGIGGGWGGTRTTSAFVDKFPDETGDIDCRAMFFTDGQNKEIEDISVFTDGYAITKWKNIQSNGSGGKSMDYPDTDFPMFRLADVYLMYAEAVLRGGTGGDPGTALNYVNLIRERAYGDESGNISANDLTLDFILDERARELYWECHRRTDLIRFGKFTGGDYLWPWKGKSSDGIATDPKYNLFPIPASDIGANPNLTQNPDYN